MPERMLKEPWRLVLFFIGIYLLLITCITLLLIGQSQRDRAEHAAVAAREMADDHILANQALIMNATRAAQKALLQAEENSREGVRQRSQILVLTKQLEKWLILNNKQNRRVIRSQILNRRHFDRRLDKLERKR